MGESETIETARHEELLSRRLSLRRPVAADVDAILEIHRDPDAVVHNPSDALETRSDAQRLFERWDGHWQRFGYGYWVVRRRGSAEPIGFCGLKTAEFRGRTVLNLFYRFGPTAWGKGLASEAARLVVSWATNWLPGQRLIARVRPANIGSQRVAARAGLERNKDLDDQGIDGLDWIYTANWPE